MGGGPGARLLIRNRSPSALRRHPTVSPRAVRRTVTLIRIFDAGTTAEDDLYLTMEFLPGGSLSARLRDGPLPIEQARSIATALLEGLAALHARGTVHRDVKPGNILFGATGVAKLADFGLVRPETLDESQLTISGGLLGTLGYLSPEQARGKKAVPASDLYAVGVILFEMLAGRLPHDADSDFGRRIAPLQAAPDVRTFRPETPRWLARIVARLLEVRPADRYATAEEALRDLRRRRAAARPRLRRLIFRAAALLLFCLLQAWFLVVPIPPPRFSHIVPLDPAGIAAVGAAGERLWTIPGVDPEASGRMPLVRTADRHRLLATILTRQHEWAPEVVFTLSFLDPETGEVVKRVRLPSAATVFPEDPPRFAVSSVTAVDLDGQGTDDLLVSYTHVPEAPSFTVLYSPRLDRSRIVFSAYGHHRFQGAADLEGRGALDLIFAGINNGWDWVNAAAAVRLDPWPDQEANWAEGSAAAPDLTTVRVEPPLLWYAILPRGQLQAPYCLTIDRAARRLRFRYLDGRTADLDFAGFPPGSPGPPIPRREVLRTETYGHLRDAERLRLAGALPAAFFAAKQAEASAAAAGESWLGEYAQRLEARILVAEGKLAEAEALFRAIAASSPDAPEVAYEAAVAFHLAGDLRRAVLWYELGFAPGARIGEGKSKHEFLKGETLALVEEKHYREALDAVARFGAALPQEQDQTPLYREYIRWRMGETPETADLHIVPFRPDLDRYWELEFELAGGAEPRALLARVERFLAERPVTESELLSLQAELLARLGHRAEARGTALRAQELVEAERPRSIVARAHTELVAERARRLGAP